MAGRPALFEAVLSGRTEAVKTILDRGQAPINTQDKFGRSALFKAVESGNGPLVRFLCEQGAPVDVRAVNGFTPLIAACVLRRADICSELLRFGADVRTQDNEGKSAIMYAAHIPDIRDMLLCRACRDGYTDSVKELLRLGANMNASDHDGWTPLIGACAGGHYPVLRELLSRSDELRSNAHRFGGAMGWNRSQPGQSFLSISSPTFSGKDALGRKSVDATLELYQQSPEKGIYLEARDSQGRTALVHASIGGFFDIAKELVERGAEVMSVDSSGKTALLHAAQGMHIGLVRYLMEQSEGHLEVCGEGGEGLLRALAQCRETLPFEKCSRHRVRAVLLFSKLFREQASADKFHAAKLTVLANACVDLATQLYDTYVEEFAKKLLAHELEGQSVLDLALEARAARFIGHPYVQQYVDDLWTGRVDQAEADEEERRDPRAAHRGWWHRTKRRIAPRTKLYLEMTSYFVYLLIFSVVVERRAMQLTALECAMYFYVATMAAEEQRQLWTEGWREYFSSVWNILDQAIFNISGASALLRLVAMVIPGHADDARLASFAYDILGCSALLLWIRLLNICTFHRRLGEMLTQIRGMFADFMTFSAIMILVMIGFSQTLHVLGADRVHGASAAFFLPAIVDMFRAILGDFDFDGVGVRSPVLGRLFLSGFLIVCNILLMNLLIATFSNTLTTVSLNSRDDLLFRLTERVLDYRSSKFRLPPPFNVFDLVSSAFRAMCGARAAADEDERGSAGRRTPQRVSSSASVQHQRLRESDSFSAPKDGSPPSTAVGSAAVAAAAAAATGAGGEDESWIDAPFRKLSTGAGGGAKKKEQSDEVATSVEHLVVPAMQAFVSKQVGEMRAQMQAMEQTIQQRMALIEQKLGETTSTLLLRLDAAVEGLSKKKSGTFGSIGGR